MKIYYNFSEFKILEIDRYYDINNKNVKIRYFENEKKLMIEF